MATWAPIDGLPRSVRSIQALTEAPPATTDASEGVGVVLDSLGGLIVWLDAGDGHTITGEAGSVDVYIHDAGLWGYAPLLSFRVPAGSSGKRRVQLGTVPISAPRGRLAPFLNGVQCSNAVAALDILATNVGGRK